jgi:competence protein CoiA
MRFALINDNRVEAQPQLRGLCSSCSRPVIAKCGTRKIWHWSHKNKTDCDNWWEPETEWHRTWKDNYPTDWQEVPLLDERTGEKHIADVRTVHNLVIEFQHSYIDPQERTSREQFYKNVVWVVDGTRLKRDYPRFLKGKRTVLKIQFFTTQTIRKYFELTL